MSKFSGVPQKKAQKEKGKKGDYSDKEEWWVISYGFHEVAN